MKRSISSFSTALSALSLLWAPLAVHAATLQPGDLIKASGAAVYYAAEDGKRYVFPTEKTYKSWYADFSSVKTITDAELAAITIGGNVTYRPGTRLIKVTTDPRVYAVEGTRLRWVASESVAKQIFGDDWAAQVDDLPDAFFVNYTIGADIDNPADYAPVAVRDSYPTIQATISAAPVIVTPPPTGTGTTSTTPTTTSTASSLSVSLTIDKATAQSNESVFLIAETPYTGSIDKLELFADDGLMTTCHAASCSGTWTIPLAGVKPIYGFRAVLTTTDGRTAEATTSTTIVSMPFSSGIQLSADHLSIRSGEAPNIRAQIGSPLTSSRTEIYVDGVSVKACVSAPNDCRYNDYLFGANGSTHDVYATVKTPSLLMYKSNTITITIGNNDSPVITLTPSLSQIAIGEMVDVTVTGQDNDGIGQMQITKDGQTLKTCAGAAPCTVSTGPWNVPSGTILTFNATVSDLLGLTSSASANVTVQ